MSQPDDATTNVEPPTPRVECIPNGLLEANCYLVMCPTSNETLVIDPGAEASRILERIEALGCKVVRVLHTHGHFDHIGATEAVLAGLPGGIPLAAHPADAYLYERKARAMCVPYGYSLPDTLALPNERLNDCDELAIGELRLEVVHTPGHTPGSISLICGTTCVFTGDTLFQHGIGRTDLPGGDEEAIYESILTRLYPLSGSLVVYPGHGLATTIEEEKRANPFVQAG